MASITLGKPERIWNKAIPGMGFMDKPMERVAKVGKAGLIAGGVIAGVAAVGAIANYSRNKNRYRPSQDRDEALSDPYKDLPPVQDFSLPGAPMQPTLMGEQLVVGQHAKRVLAARGGLSSGVDPSSPNIQSASGSSLIDGKPVQDLGAPARV